MKKIFYLVLVSLSIFESAFSQSYFNNIYRYSSSDSIYRTEYIIPVLEIPGSGYIAGGGSDNYMTKNGLIMFYNLDYAGNVLSTITYGDSGYFYTPTSIEYTNDGNVIMNVAKTKYTNPHDSIWMSLYKLDVNGNLIWSNQYSSGKIKTQGLKAIETSDKGFAILGWTTDSNSIPAKAYLVKTDSLGNKEWDMMYGDSANYYYNGFSLLQESDGGYVLMGFVGTNGTYYRMISIMRTDSAGNKLWQEDYGAPNLYAHGEWITKLKDGNYLISGQNGIPFGDTNGLLIKTDTLGNVIWQKNYGFSVASIIRGVVENSDGTICFNLGQTLGNPSKSIANLYKVDANGDSLWSRQYVYDTTIIDNNCYSYYMTSTSDGGYIISGSENQGFPNTMDAWLVKVDSLGCLVPGCLPVGIFEQQEDLPFSITNYPNPFSNNSIIEIKGLKDFAGSCLLIENTLGQPVKQFLIKQQDSKFELSAANLSPGVYYYTVISKDKARLKTKIMSVIK